MLACVGSIAGRNVLSRFLIQARFSSIGIAPVNPFYEDALFVVAVVEERYEPPTPNGLGANLSSSSRTSLSRATIRR